MKHQTFILIVLFFGISTSLFAQNEKISNDTTEKAETFVIIEKPAQFPGGLPELYNFLKENIRYPEVAKGMGITGTAYIQFIVKEDGSIGKVKALNELDFGLTEEAIRVVKLMPKWIPSISNEGDTAASYFTIPIKFALDGNCNNNTSIIKLYLNPSKKQTTKNSNLRKIFPEGNDKIGAYFYNSMVYPQEAIKKKYKGSVTAYFAIDSVGNTYDIHCFYSRYKGGRICSEAVKKAIEKMPQWDVSTSKRVFNDETSKAKIYYIKIEFSPRQSKKYKQ